MAYTRVWADVNNLLGTRDSDEIDDASRETHVDLTERLTDILFDVAADPWKVKIPGVSGDGSQNHLVHPVAGNVFGNVGMDVSIARSVQPLAVGNSGTWAGPIAVPRGSTLKSVVFHVVRSTAGAAVVCRVIKVDDSGTPTTVGSDAAAVSGSPQLVTVGGLTEQFTSTAVYYLEVFLTADGSLVTSAQFLWADLVIQLAGL